MHAMLARSDPPVHLPPDPGPVVVFRRCLAPDVERTIPDPDAPQGVSLGRGRREASPRHAPTAECQIVRVRTHWRLASLRGGALLGSDAHSHPLAWGRSPDDRTFPDGASRRFAVEEARGTDGDDDGGGARCRYREDGERKRDGRRRRRRRSYADAARRRPGRRLLARADHVQDDEATPLIVPEIRRPASRHGQRLPPGPEELRGRVGRDGRAIERSGGVAYLHRGGVRTIVERIGGGGFRGGRGRGRTSARRPAEQRGAGAWSGRPAGVGGTHVDVVGGREAQPTEEGGQGKGGGGGGGGGQMNPTSPLSPSQLRYLNTGENECNLTRDSHGIKGASNNVTGGLNKSLKWSSPPVSFRTVDN